MQDNEKIALVNRKPKLCDFIRIVQWLQSVVGDKDPRGFNPIPVLLFAKRYKMAKFPAEKVYEEYVRYQCHVIEYCASELPDDVINDISFTEMQEWYESLPTLK